MQSVYFAGSLGPVGFSAYNSVDQYLTADQIAHFDQVITNFGGHFNSMTSSFVCPCHGIYLFTLNFNTYNSDGLNLALMQNSALLVQAVADRAEDGALTTGSASVVVECGPSEMIWVEGADSASGAFGGNSARRSHFMGYMLYSY